METRFKRFFNFYDETRYAGMNDRGGVENGVHVFVNNEVRYFPSVTAIGIGECPLGAGTKYRVRQQQFLHEQAVDFVPRVFHISGITLRALSG